MSVAGTGAADPLGLPLAGVVGDRTAKVLVKELRLATLGDLLRYYPRRYYERGEFSDLSRVQLDEEITVQAEVAKVTKHPGPGRRPPRVEVEITDGRGSLQLTFFNSWVADRELRPGKSGLFAGKVGSFRGRPQVVQPEYYLYDADEDEGKAAEEFAKPRPVYPATAKLPTWTIERCVRVVLDSLPQLEDPLPAALRKQFRLMDLRTAFERVHRPDEVAETFPAKERLKWDEALPLQIVLAKRRLASLGETAAARESRPGGVLERFDQRLPFTLTAGQQAVCAEIEQDLAQTHPMHRLLQGEVGSGKTIVALRAMLTVVDGGGQAVLLAPTEVLAQQHHRSITQMLGSIARPGQLDGDPDGTKVALLTGSQGAKERKANLLDAAGGDAGIVVGTHAVIQEHVQFQDLGLVVVDEQHRFGVEQRDALRAKGSVPPHLLVMTATPIPRTVAMTVFGDLETSVLAELPGGRSPISTHVVPALEKPNFFVRAWERIREEVAAGHQAYVVCPRIGGEAGDETDGDESDAPPPEAAESERRAPLAVADIAAELEAGPLAGLRIGVLHGRLAPAEKDEVMTAFNEGSLDVLVATTVVEVGVNVPNASVMVILDADRFGVSQLHQLRGRVGRGSVPGLCLLVTEAFADTPARERLDAVAGTLDGFELSRIDLEQRREGDVLGAAQSGRRSSLRLLSVLKDEELIGRARQAATELVAEDPELAGQPGLRAAVAALQDSDRADYLAMT
ncbi:ATP-dependent DNA helicase RecG [Actinospica robiniae]|uniref:ATP-dependent DNA helicase RecG n=1 Tax=Actinospica robiniae TaxID=304901 RepID=UPI0004048E3E|nr:ATP-dependent DNA helicase RecG [Actinospica robiniae]